MELKDALINVPQREVSGSRTAARLDYQKNWALKQMLKKHTDNLNYVFVFEFHDDVLVPDSSTDPQKIDFYQVKTLRGKNWTIKGLLTREKGESGLKLSFIGKLYQHKEDFPDHPSSLNFVTNAYFSFDKEKTVICAADIKEEEQNDLIKSIKQQVPALKQIELADLSFRRTSLSLDGQESHIKGELHNFFNHFFGDNHTIPIEAWYKTITDEIKRKNNYPQSGIKSFDDLIKNKSITKDSIDKFLLDVERSHQIRPKWNTVCNILTANNISARELLKIEDSWHKYSVEKLDCTNAQLVNLSKAVNDTIKNESLSDNNLVDYIDNIYSIFIKEYDGPISPYNYHYIKAVILWEYCEQE